MKNVIVSSRKACFSGRRFYISRPDINESHFKAAGVELKSFPDELHTKSLFFFGIKTAYIMQHTQHTPVKTNI